MNSQIYDASEIKRTIDFLKPNSQLFEIRVIKAKWNASGYFTSGDKLIEELTRINSKSGVNIYITLNSINQSCYSREQRDKLVEYASPTTSDSDIEKYEWLMIDLDPVRASGTSSSDEELSYAKSKANDIYKFLFERGFSSPVVALSGNGVHLLYRIDLANNTSNKELIKGVLMVLDMLFSDDKVNVDTTTFNSARICKLYGTIAQKGFNSVDRPHRISRMVSNSNVDINSRDVLVELLNLLPKTIQEHTTSQYGKFDLESFLSKYNISYKSKSNCSIGTKYVLEECIFDCNHKAPDSAIFVMSNGSIGYKCFHNSCMSYTWKDVRNKFEPNYELNQRANTQNFSNSNVVLPKAKLETSNGLLTVDTIEIPRTVEREYTNIVGLDYLLKGIEYGKLSLWSGITNHGKTTLMIQFAKECIKNAKKIFYFSGEQTAEEFKNYLYVGMCSKEQLEYVKDEHNSKIYDIRPQNNVIAMFDDMYRDYIYVYNNNSSNNTIEFMISIMEQALQKGVRIYFIDNFMQLDDSEKLEKQTKIVEAFKRFAREKNCIINLVAHPRKTQFQKNRLTIFDIAGTQNIANKSANICTIIRTDLLPESEFREVGSVLAKNSYDIADCDAVVEVIKTKGNSCKMVGLKYDRELKKYYEAPIKVISNDKAIKKLPLNWNTNKKEKRELYN